MLGSEVGPSLRRLSILMVKRISGKDYEVGREWKGEKEGGMPLMEEKSII